MLSLQDPFVVSFKGQLLRWNQQISLVSRKGTSDVLDTLLHQSCSGVESLHTYVNKVVRNSVDNSPSGAGDNPVDNPWNRVLYFDLGSGGGLPGIIWAHQLFKYSSFCRSFLVEPRQKRSWFLDRVINQSLPLQESSEGHVEVISDRWGGGVCGDFVGPQVSTIIISMKALRLVDEVVLKGLVSFLGQDVSCVNLFIARYYPASQEIDDDLRISLGLPDEGHTFPVLPGAVFQGAEVLAVPPAGFLPSSLVVSRYKLLPL